MDGEMDTEMDREMERNCGRKDSKAVVQESWRVREKNKRENYRKRNDRKMDGIMKGHSAISQNILVLSPMMLLSYRPCLPPAVSTR